MPDTSIYSICYISNELTQIHSLSLRNLDFGNYIKKPFSFVPNDSRQPALLESNIHNVNDENEYVLGFFSMAGMVEKRAFAIKPEGLDLSPYEDQCFVMPKPGEEYNTMPHFRPGGYYPHDPPPIYLSWHPQVPLPPMLTSKACVDCREYKNSTDIKPDFW